MWPRPRSLVHLLLASFVMVTLPLLTALYQAGKAMDQLAGQSRRTVLAGVEAARLSGDLKELLLNMERRARQYQVLKNKQFLSLYGNDHNKLTATRDKLHQLATDADNRRDLEQLQQLAGDTWQALQQPSSEQSPEVVAPFAEMHALARRINLAAGRQIDRELGRLQAAVTDSQQQLYLYAALMGPITLLLILITTFLINRPIGRLDQAIRGLGGGRFDQPIAVEGPRDLAYLGERLEWLRERLNQLEQQKSQFLRHISHELKTPLASMREGTELLADRITGPLTPQQTDVVAILDTNSRHLQKLIENLLDYNHIQTGGNLNWETFETGELIAEVVAVHRLSATAKNLRFELPEKDWQITADRAKIRTALDNLISNAINFSPKGGWIRLHSAVTREHFQLEIRDQGPGIPEAERDQVFEPFFQGSTQRQGHLKGSGIGLSIARECLSVHGGRLELVASESGTCFRLTLPMTRKEEQR